MLIISNRTSINLKFKGKSKKREKSHLREIPSFLFAILPLESEN